MVKPPLTASTHELGVIQDYWDYRDGASNGRRMTLGGRMYTPPPDPQRYLGKTVIVPAEAYASWGSRFEEGGAQVVCSWAHTTFRDITNEVATNNGILPSHYVESLAVGRKFLFQAGVHPQRPFQSDRLTTPGQQLQQHSANDYYMSPVNILRAPSHLPYMALGEFHLGLHQGERLRRLNRTIPSFQANENPNIFVSSFPSMEFLAQGRYGVIEVERCLVSGETSSQVWERLAFVTPTNPTRKTLLTPSPPQTPYTKGNDFWAKYVGNDIKGRGQWAWYHTIKLSGSDRSHKYLYRARQHLLNHALKPIASSTESPTWTYADRKHGRASPSPAAEKNVPSKRQKGCCVTSERDRNVSVSDDLLCNNPEIAENQFCASCPIVVDANQISSASFDLLQASLNGSIEQIKSALYHGADVNIQDHSGHTPLFLATREGHQDAMKVLLKRRAKPNIANKAGVNPLIWATLHDATDSVALLLEWGADVNVQYDKNTPLHFAVINACLKGSQDTASTADSPTVRLLKEKGAYLFAKDGEGRTPLHIAQYFDNEKMMGILNPFIGVSVPPDLVDPLPSWSKRSSTGHQGFVTACLAYLTNPLDVLDSAPTEEKLPSFPEVLAFYVQKLWKYGRYQCFNYL